MTLIQVAEEIRRRSNFVPHPRDAFEQAADLLEADPDFKFYTGADGVGLLAKLKESAERLQSEHTRAVWGRYGGTEMGHEEDNPDPDCADCLFLIEVRRTITPDPENR